ncbi:DUF3238 domain-containing protein [Paenibacillus pini]|uniref:Uncharacterized protein n=1 Tax=Paenibacillus pini JCM 16418 TaxID=1236976 RepID=W7YVY7_9BACL|nr:DUF3238 domain-containing protein [Paenibacillus pini]GAF08786.1 hypothetical protein JCM16418_2891 [Paenibacillus pini JCM 16418]
MANNVSVRITAFIPDEWITFMQTSAVKILYKGNNRGFKYETENEPDKWKLCSHINVNFLAKTVTHYAGVGPTTERTVDIKTNEILRPDITGQASSDGVRMTSSSFQANGDYADFTLKAAVNIPTFNPSPDIDWEYNVRVYKTGKVTVTGKHDAYPAHEVWKKVDSSTPVSLHTYNPKDHGETVYTGLIKFNQNVNVVQG